MLRFTLVSRLLLAATRLATVTGLVLAAGGAAHSTAGVIDNGLDCSNPGNVIDYNTGEGVAVYDAPAGGPTEVCLVAGGATGDGDLEAYDSSFITMSGGTVGDSMSAYDFSTITMSGGVAGSDLFALDSSTFIFVGSGFKVDDVSVPFGELTALSGVLTGTLASGDPIDNVFYQGGYDFGFGSLATGTMILAPEPGTGLLVMTGLLGLAFRQKRRT